MNTNKLQAKDLINVGIYTAIYALITSVLAFLSLMPIFYPLLTVICPIAGGIPLMLFLTKTKKFGMITIMGALMGIIMLLTGMGYFCIFTGVGFGLLAELILKSGGYASAKKSVLTSGVFSMWYIGNYITFFITRESRYQDIAAGYGTEYADALFSYFPNWMFIVLLASCFVSGLVGGLLGKALLKKHFQKAGIA